MNSFDVVIVGYAVNQKSGGYSDNRFTFLQTIGGRYLYSNCFLDTYCAEPMAFMQLSAELKAAGWRVQVIDGLILGYDKQRLKEELDKVDSNIFCFSIYESSKQDVYEMIHHLKMKRPAVNVILGGPYATISANEIMDENIEIDYIIVGDADVALPKLVSKISKNIDVFSVPNLFHRRSGELIINDAIPVDLDKLKFPDRLYSDIIIKEGYSFSVSSSRGCGYASCGFCYLSKYQKVGGQPKFRYKNPKLVVNEMKDLIDKYDIKKLSFCDEDFFGDENGVKRALEIFRLLIEENIKIALHVNTRVKTVIQLANKDLLKLCTDAGVVYMYVGLESYNDAALVRYDKNISTSDIDYVVNELDKHKILINPGLITFDPELSIDEVKNNIDLFRRINYYDAFIFTRRLIVYPNASQKIRELQINEDYFTHLPTKLLYNAMSKYLDLIFPKYINLNRNLITEELKNKLIQCHFDYFYTAYDMLKTTGNISGTVLEQFANHATKILSTIDA